ncbi:MAG: 3-hydroxyacyl-CoA dehydrogenase NAD-binding domain-containing protein [Burkholderiaceae bacterium]|jgi:3-hydroxyacyl-CoA dehydrogenase
MTASFSERGDIAVITLDNPPVNGLGFATRSGIVDGVQRAIDHPAIRAIVLIGSGKGFSGGADIREFNTPKAMQEPSLHTVIRTIESCEKPVIAAIHGLAMGGGLELALGCHYRVASSAAQIALPEVKLGILPGAGGTQRLPRMIGLQRALTMIVHGAPVPSEQLADTHLFDRMLAGDLLEGAIAYAHEIADIRPLPKVRDHKINDPAASQVLQAMREQIKAQAKHYPAPTKCIDAVEAAINLPFEDGLSFERELFLQLVQTTESKALRHSFFAERSATKIPGVGAETALREIRTAAVIGAGTMGAGIAMNFANAGIPVYLLETEQTALDKGLSTIQRNYENTLKKGRLTQEQLDKRMALISTTLDYEALSNADIVIEAVFEEISVKETVFRRLDQVMKPGAILASNTSTLDLDKIASFTLRPQDVIGMHFFSPANVMKLLEVVRGKATADDVLATVMALAKKIKKTGVVSGVCDGFIGNRMIEQYLRQAFFLLEEGCLPAQIDQAIENFGFAMGPFRMSDLAGNDIGWHIRQRRRVERPDMVYSQIGDKLCERGRFGQKTSAGWYDYHPGDRAAHVSDEVNQMIITHAAELGVVRRAIGDEEIVERLIYALANEGARILEEGIALRASDIDLVYLTGYGFPLYRGGPMFYASGVGLDKVMLAVQHYASGPNGHAWQVAPLLKKFAEAGKAFQ